MNKFDWMERLSLLEHLEGGYFAEIYRSPTSMDTNREGKERAVLTSIYYMLTDDRPIDRFHKNQSDI
uniref:cupin domain-containing protein n=1 Tax=Geitlerinema sp. PCC 9228 TaxID=111611 RepID=UPI0011148F60